MTPHVLLILEIIKESLVLANQIAAHLTPEQWAEFAARQARWDAFWQEILTQLKD